MACSARSLKFGKDLSGGFAPPGCGARGRLAGHHERSNSGGFGGPAGTAPLWPVSGSGGLAAAALAMRASLGRSSSGAVEP